jgi:hypothetical protein
LQQVVLNLILNALEAMARSRRGHERCSSAPSKTKQAPSWRCEIPGRALIRRIWSAFSRHSTRRSPAERGWGCRFAGQSSRPMGAGYGQRQTNLAALYYSSPCPARRRHHEFSSVRSQDVSAKS